LGASTSNVMTLILRQGMTTTAVGVLAGVLGSWALTRLMQSMLFGTSATDPFTFCSVVALLVVVALLACYVPARRATRVDPMAALRNE
ncbi:MAG TPA: FtsX-like permease family protein, partial [Alphaproteobacteria bacterium]|nr:FtsX-like permease family protein [Alphaproteobacteria bacterium]